MRIITAAELEEYLDFASLVEGLRETYRGGADAPDPARFELGDHGAAADGTLVARPAWRGQRDLGVMVSTDFPSNTSRGLARHMAVFLLFERSTGRLLSMIDGPAPRARRLAGTSALAARHLARPDCQRLLVMGSGPQAAVLVEAHCSVRPVVNVLAWSPDGDASGDTSQSNTAARGFDRRFGRRHARRAYHLLLV